MKRFIESSEIYIKFESLKICMSKKPFQAILLQSLANF